MNLLLLFFLALRVNSSSLSPILLTFGHFRCVFDGFYWILCFLGKISQNKSVSLDVIIIVVFIIQELFDIVSLLFSFDDVTDLCQQNLLDLRFETILCLVETGWQLEVSLALLHDLIQVINIIYIVDLKGLGLVWIQAYLNWHFRFDIKK